MLVKEITPVLHRLQEAFWIYEDQYDGEWDRGWYRFEEMFPQVKLNGYSRREGISILLRRYAFRMVWFDGNMAKSFYRLPGKEIGAAADRLVEEGVFVREAGGYLLAEDQKLLTQWRERPLRSVFALHRNDMLVKSNEHWLKERYKREGLDILQYLLIDGEFHGAVLGHFKNGPYLLEDVVLDGMDENFAGRREEILDAVYRVNSQEASPLRRFLGQEL